MPLRHNIIAGRCKFRPVGPLGSGRRKSGTAEPPHGHMNMEPEAGLDAVSPRDERSRAGLEHWPAEVWSDYAAAYVRLTTLRTDGDHHLLFGCVELLPREIAPLPSHRAPRLSLPRGASAMSSLTVLTPEAALQWYEGALSGMVALPGVDAPPTIRAVRLAAEPRLGDLVGARVATVPVGWQTGPRMHRLVPMEETARTGSRRA